MPFEYKHFQAKDKAHKGKWTFTVDGEPTGFYTPTEDAVLRCIDRLKTGRGAVFGGPAVVDNTGREVGKVRAVAGREFPIRARIVQDKSSKTTVTTKSGREKPREIQGAFRYELDGELSKEAFETEQEAREAAAVRGFLTRGKYGRVKEAEEAFQEKFGKKAKVAVEDGAVVARAGKQTYSVGLAPGQPPEFKPIASGQKDGDE